MTEGKEGGTWLGLSENGKIASLLNLYSAEKNPDAKSRGFLVMDYIKTNDSARSYLQKIVDSKVAHDNFSFIALEPSGSGEIGENSVKPYELIYMNNADSNILSLGAGFHGFGNTHLNCPLNKVKEGKTRFQEIIENIGPLTSNESKLTESLLELMADKTEYFPDQILQRELTKVPEFVLPKFSSIFCSVPSFGSRLVVVENTVRNFYQLNFLDYL